MLWTSAVVLFPDVIAIFCACASIKARFRLTAAIQASAIFLKTNTNSNKIKIKISLNRIRSRCSFFCLLKNEYCNEKNFQRNSSFHTRRIFRSDSSPPWIMINGLPVNFDLIIYIFQLWKSLRNFIQKPLYKNTNLPSSRFAVHDTKQFLIFSLASRWLHQCPCSEAHIFFLLKLLKFSMNMLLM